MVLSSLHRNVCTPESRCLSSAASTNEYVPNKHTEEKLQLYVHVCISVISADHLDVIVSAEIHYREKSQERRFLLVPAPNLIGHEHDTRFMLPKGLLL
jgi:hypothetical protein